MRYQKTSICKVLENFIHYMISNINIEKVYLYKILTQHQKKFINFICFVEYYSEFLYDNTVNPNITN